MNILLVLAHPAAGSFNHSIAQEAAGTLRSSGHEVVFHDLYAEGFDPILPADEIADGAAPHGCVDQHCAEISRADGIVVVHPNWWGQPPAIMKGWIDRVFRPGVAYRFLEGDGGEGVPQGLLRAKAAVVFNTANTPETRENAVFGDPLVRMWRDCIFGLCGVEEFHRKVFRVVVTSSAEQRQVWLREVVEMMDRVFPGQGPGTQVYHRRHSVKG